MAGCVQYSLALDVIKSAAELAQATPELDKAATASYTLGWQRYCQEAAHDLQSAARAKSVSDALRQLADKYQADIRSGGTDESRGRAAAAQMLMEKCQDLVQGAGVTSESQMKRQRSGRFWPQGLRWRRRGPAG
jgi:hypothetical protein